MSVKKIIKSNFLLMNYASLTRSRKGESAWWLNVYNARFRIKRIPSGLANACVLGKDSALMYRLFHLGEEILIAVSQYYRPVIGFGH